MAIKNNFDQEKQKTIFEDSLLSVAREYLSSTHCKIFSKMIKKVFLILIVILFIGNCNATLGRVKRQSRSCGVAGIVGRGLIVSGKSFERGKFPWMVALMEKINSEHPTFFCGGTLVSTNKVMTGMKFKESVKTLRLSHNRFHFSRSLCFPAIPKRAVVSTKC